MILVAGGGPACSQCWLEKLCSSLFYLGNLVAANELSDFPLWFCTNFFHLFPFSLHTLTLQCLTLLIIHGIEQLPSNPAFCQSLSSDGTQLKSPAYKITMLQVAAWLKWNINPQWNVSCNTLTIDISIDRLVTTNTHFCTKCWKGGGDIHLIVNNLEINRSLQFCKYKM